MKEIKDFMHMIGDLASMSDCPNFSDEMRNGAVELMLYINKNTESEKPLIIKSGGTWVAHYEGVDYLFTSGLKVSKDKPPSLFYTHRPTEEIALGFWKPFSEITLDDEIAKLRPMVKIGNNLLVKLYGVLGETLAPFRIVGFPSYRDMYGRVTGYNYEKATLATPKELQELS